MPEVDEVPWSLVLAVLAIAPGEPVLLVHRVTTDEQGNWIRARR